MLTGFIKEILIICFMILFTEAFEIIMNSAFETGSEEIPFTKSFNRVLAEDIVSDIDMPPFNKSAVDGYACKKEDLGNELELLEIIPAGKKPSRKIGKGQCSKIMTGAAIPYGADFVFMAEDSIFLPSCKVKFSGSSLKDNVLKKGEDLRKGDTVIRSGKLIKPQDIAVMAAVGRTTVLVRNQPGVAVISTGNEIIEPSLKPDGFHIRNSNAYQLLAQIDRAGGFGKYYGIVPDDETETFNVVQKSISENDIVILTGGVSMGDFDFVPEILEKAGAKILFRQIAVQPGKPTTFGIHPDSLVFGLPGNPVSAFIQFEVLIRPLLAKMMRSEWTPRANNYPMKVRFTRKSVNRLAWIPVVISPEGMVSPVEYHGSAHISALPYADGIVAVPVGKGTIEKGESVSVRQI